MPGGAAPLGRRPARGPGRIAGADQRVEVGLWIVVFTPPGVDLDRALACDRQGAAPRASSPTRRARPRRGRCEERGAIVERGRTSGFTEQTCLALQPSVAARTVCPPVEACDQRRVQSPSGGRSLTRFARSGPSRGRIVSKTSTGWTLIGRGFLQFRVRVTSGGRFLAKFARAGPLERQGCVDGPVKLTLKKGRRAQASAVMRLWRVSSGEGWSRGDLWRVWLGEGWSRVCLWRVVEAAPIACRPALGGSPTVGAGRGPPRTPRNRFQ